MFETALHRQEACRLPRERKQVSTMDVHYESSTASQRHARNSQMVFTTARLIRFLRISGHDGWFCSFGRVLFDIHQLPRQAEHPSTAEAQADMTIRIPQLSPSP